jgi:hypothetical protein
MTGTGVSSVPNIFDFSAKMCIDSQSGRQSSAMARIQSHCVLREM